jgi:starch synthase
MEKKRVLHVSQANVPFLPTSEIGETAKKLAQGVQESGKEIRVFMPRFGCINERRHQLHEVIRLSGMNLIIDDTDHPLIIKVASIPSARMQVYFIDNEEFFKRKATLKDEDGEDFDDNDERSMFFCRGVLETVKKLGWKPDVIHCHGSLTSMMPMYIKDVYKDDPHFSDSKVVTSLYNEDVNKNWDKNFVEKLKFEGFNEAVIGNIKAGDHVSLLNEAVRWSDGVVVGSDELSENLASIVSDTGKQILEFSEIEAQAKLLSDFYDKVIEEEVLVD